MYNMKHTHKPLSLSTMQTLRVKAFSLCCGEVWKTLSESLQLTVCFPMFGPGGEALLQT